MRSRRSTQATVVAPPLRDVAVGTAHLAVLSAFGLAQPLFDLLGKNAEFFVVRGSTKWDIIIFALSVTIVPPVALGIVELLARLLSARLQRGIHLFFIACLAALLAVQGLKRIDALSSTAALVGAGLLGVAAAAAYWRIRATRAVLTALTPAPLLFLCLFLFVSPVSKLTLTGEAQAAVPGVPLTTSAAKSRVVMVVFDEFPAISLRDQQGNIDAVRYPHFAELARSSTWFRNATTVSGSTTRAVPAIMTGMYPRKGLLPNFHDHPKNIFTLLGGGYRLNVFEPETSVCPRSLCHSTQKPAERFASRMSSLYSDVDVIYLHVIAPPKLEARLPDVSSSWLNFRHGGADPSEQTSVVEVTRGQKKKFWEGRHGQFERFIKSIKPSQRPELDFIHVLLPHGPWEYFSSGTQYAQIPGYGSPRDFDTWHRDQELILQTYERHLLQVGFVDRLLGELLRRLRKVGAYDESLIVVTADHGISFRPGDRRRGPTSTNLQDIAFPPLFIKVPGQKQGSIDEAHVQSIDILPTIADVLGISIPWTVDGRSAFQGPHTSVVNFPLEGLTADAARLEKKRDEALRLKIHFFGSGRGGPGLFAIAPHHELVGRRVATLPIASSTGAAATIDSKTRARLGSVKPTSGLVPALIGGNIVRGRAGMTLAIAVNGRIATLTRSYSIGGSVRYAGLVPESVFHRGANHVQVLSVEELGGSLTFRSLGILS